MCVVIVLLFSPKVEEDEDEFLTPTKTDGEHNHNNNGSKEKCESIIMLSPCLFESVKDMFIVCPLFGATGSDLNPIS